MDALEINALSSPIQRRSLFGLMAAAILPSLAACASYGHSTEAEGVRRLLVLACNRAFARMRGDEAGWSHAAFRLKAPQALHDAVEQARVGVGSQPGGLDQIVSSLTAEAALPRLEEVLREALRAIGIPDPQAIVAAGDRAGTIWLRKSLGSAFALLLPGLVAEAFEQDRGIVVQEARRMLDPAASKSLAADLAVQAESAVWAAIATEEAAIRADVRGTGDRVIMASFGLM